MKEQQNQFLRLLGQLPTRLNAEQVAWVLNCQPHDVPVLVAARLLKPLGNPQPNSVKYFAALEVLELARDRAWLARMTNALNHHWQEKMLPSDVLRWREDSVARIIFDRNSQVRFYKATVQARVKSQPCTASCTHCVHHS
jgi:hypothetical protein